jgi:hypothetical protein
MKKYHLSHFLIVLLIALFVFGALKQQITPIVTYNISQKQFKKDPNYDVQVALQIGHCAYDLGQDCDNGTVKNNGTHYGERNEPNETKHIALKTREYLINAGLNPDDVMVFGATKDEINMAKQKSVKYFITFHYDGGVRVCTTGTSVGYPSDITPFIQNWKTRYKSVFPFKVMNDNFSGLRMKKYYMFGSMNAKEKMLIEFGEYTCIKQYKWLNEHRDWLGEFVGEFLTEQSQI